METTSSYPRPGRPISSTPAAKPPLICPAPPSPHDAAPVKPASVTPTTVVPVEVTAARAAAQDPEPAPEPPLYPDEVIALALSPAQLTAIQKMLSGHSLGASAGAAGVTRQTLYNWIHHDPKFQAAYNAWQLDALTSVRTKLLSMADVAVNTLGRAVKHDPRVALAVLKAIGTLTPAQPGSTDPEEVEQRMELKRSQEQQELGEKMFWTSIGSRTGGPDPIAAMKELRRHREEKERQQKSQAAQ